MKTKSLVLLVTFIFLAAISNAQLKIGLRAGISSSNVKLKNYTSTQYELEYKKGNYGYHFGVIAQLKIKKFYLQPELLFTTAKSDIAYKDLVNPSNSQIGRQNFNKIDIPVILGYKIAIFKLQAGPVATFMLYSKSDLLKEKNITQDYKGATFGYQAGVGVELSSLLIDFKYEGNLSKLGSGMNVNGTNVNFDQRMSQLIFSLGFLF
jgi:hypothetical protein